MLATEIRIIGLHMRSAVVRVLYHALAVLAGIVARSPVLAREGLRTPALVYFHVPETGGETVNAFVKTLGDSFSTRAQHVRVMSRNDWQGALVQLKALREGTSTRPLYVELHGDSPTFQELRSELATLRSSHEGALQVAVTVREPFAWAVGAYNFFCGPSPFLAFDRGCIPYTASVDQLLQMGPNPQCHYLTKGWNAHTHFTHATTTDRVTAEECEELAQAVQHEVDFVGTPEELPTFLERVRESLGFDATGPIDVNTVHVNKGKGGLMSPQMLLEHRVQVHRLTQLDVQFVGNVTNWRQREACFNTGEYQARAGTKPPYTPFDNHQKCNFKKRRQYTWHDWQWVPTPVTVPQSSGSSHAERNTLCSPNIGRLTREELCLSLGTANVLIVGDSLSFQTYVSLVLRAGDGDIKKYAVANHTGGATPLVSLCNHRASLQFIPVYLIRKRKQAKADALALKKA